MEENAKDAFQMNPEGTGNLSMGFSVRPPICLTVPFIQAKVGTQLS